MKKSETPHDRFIRLATKRTNAVLEKLRVLGHCSNRSLYDYTDQEVDKIFASISRQIQEAKSKFKSKRSNKFSL